METVTIGIIGAGNRGEEHVRKYRAVDGATVKAIADIDTDAAGELADEFGIPDVYEEFEAMLDDPEIDVVNVCVHNNLHEPMAVAAFEADKHVFCEKPLAGSYTDAKNIVDAAEAADKLLAVQNVELLTPETQAARTFVESGDLGEVAFARSVYSRRRGRPYVDGYGTPAFVSKESAGGGPVFDIGTYEIGRNLYLLGNPAVERVNGQTFDYTDDSLGEELTGDNAELYRERLEESGHDVEDAGTGAARLADGSRLEVRAAWHAYQPDERGVVVGSQGGIAFDPVELLTTMNDYETTVEIDVDGFETRHGLIRGESGYEVDERPNQYDHFVAAVRGEVDQIRTDEIALNSMLVMEGIYLSAERGREVSAEEIAEASVSRSVDL
ncbi:Gfo/Idh/MocA family protein [Halomicrobium katesii]|uniref:Gfo/Idh/MocA family protein n=1 Tax=Halomicrobium katesii TaxID=437163 RepID=UPI0003773E42|nr:Gfo/Idh/MocA family oxidoreductase [Halomicrobium katesii]